MSDYGIERKLTHVGVQCMLTHVRCQAKVNLHLG